MSLTSSQLGRLSAFGLGDLNGRAELPDKYQDLLTEVLRLSPEDIAKKYPGTPGVAHVVYNILGAYESASGPSITYIEKDALEIIQMCIEAEMRAFGEGGEGTVIRLAFDAIRNQLAQ